MTAEPKTITVEMARAAVLASGLLEDIAGPAFSADGEDWTRYWIAKTPPALAKVALKRKGMPVREVVISWAEYEAGEELTPDWNATRALKPMSVFGGECERHAYRVLFADVIAAAFGPRAVESGDGDPWAAPAVPRDFMREVTEATTPGDVDRIWEEARGHRTPQLERLCRERKRALLVAGGVPVPGERTAANVTRPAPAVIPHPPAPDVPHLEKPTTRKGESRARRDSGRRGGGRRG